MAFGVSQEQIRTIVEEEVADIKSQTDKLAGKALAHGEVAANWQSGTAPISGEAGAVLVSIGTAGDRQKLHSLIVNIGQLTSDAVITIKLFRSIYGTDTKVYPPPGTTWTVGTDPNGIWVVDGTLEITGVLRVEVYSNDPTDNGKKITYEYDLEDM
ncbi:hypothetical protein ES703_30625 [subsurface metagenome]